ncbi:hypothetical protein ABVT39_002120 [Epinephelus coioides]
MNTRPFRVLARAVFTVKLCCASSPRSSLSTVSLYFQAAQRSGIPQRTEDNENIKQLSDEQVVTRNRHMWVKTMCERKHLESAQIISCCVSLIYDDVLKNRLNHVLPITDACSHVSAESQPPLVIISTSSPPPLVARNKFRRKQEVCFLQNQLHYQLSPSLHC